MKNISCESNIKSYVLDTYAVLCYLRNEKGADAVGDILTAGHEGKARLFISWINLGEVYYIAQREAGVNKARTVIEMIKNWPVELVEPTEKDILAAGDIKAQYPLAYADAFAFALAQNRKAELVTGDMEFAKPERDGVAAIMWLPNK